MAYLLHDFHFYRYHHNNKKKTIKEKRAMPIPKETHIQYPMGFSFKSKASLVIPFFPNLFDFKSKITFIKKKRKDNKKNKRIYFFRNRSSHTKITIYTHSKIKKSLKAYFLQICIKAKIISGHFNVSIQDSSIEKFLIIHFHQWHL